MRTPVGACTAATASPATSSSASKMFIAGEPMKPATKRLAGVS